MSIRVPAPSGTSATDTGVTEIIGYRTPASQVNWGSVGHNSAYPLNLRRISSGNQNDEITYNVKLEGGTYTFDLYHQTGPNRGVYTVAIADIASDGTVGAYTTLGTIDGYAASEAIAISSLTALAITAGRKRVRLRMATKNASSAQFFGSFAAFSFSRTGA